MGAYLGRRGATVVPIARKSTETRAQMRAKARVKMRAKVRLSRRGLGGRGGAWAYIYLYVHYIESQNQIAIFTRAVLSPQDTIYIRTGMILNQNFMLKTNIDRYNVLPCAPLLLMTDTFRPGQTAPLCMSTSIDYQGSQGTSERSILRSNIQNTGTRTHIDAHPSPAIRFPP